MAYFFSKINKPTRDWLGQRLTAILMIALLAYLLVYLQHHDFTLPAAVDLAGNKLVVAVAVLFWLIFDHGKLGFAVIIEDYVHGARAQHAAIFFNILVSWLFKIITLLLAYYLYRGQTS